MNNNNIFNEMHEEAFANGSQDSNMFEARSWQDTAGLEYEPKVNTAEENARQLAEEEERERRIAADELKRRAYVVDKLITKKDLLVARGESTKKILTAINEANSGIYTSPEASRFLKEYEKVEAKEAKQEAKSAVNSELQNIIQAYNYYYLATGSGTYYYQSLEADEYGNRIWYAQKADALRTMHHAVSQYITVPDGEAYSGFREFNRLLAESNRVVNDVIQSYRNKPGTLNLMQQKFCEPNKNGEVDYHWIFDAIIESLSGTAPNTNNEIGAFEAMQMTIWAKYLHPENTYIPHVFIKDLEGRAGKGLVANTFLRRLFNGSIADNCNSDHVTGKFNAYIAGKAIVVVNETRRDKVDVERMKAFLGSPVIAVEQKYMPTYEADNTALVFSFTNEEAGGITLSGTQSDNRYSMFETNGTIYKICKKYFADKEGIDISEIEVKAFIEGKNKTSGQMLLSSEEQVSKWINAMAIKYGDVQTVSPWHSTSYFDTIERQRGAWTHVVESVFEDPDFSYIRADMLADLVREYCRGEAIPGRNRMNKEIERLIKDRGYKIERVQRCKIYQSSSANSDCIQRPVYRVPSLLHVVEEFSTYGKYDDNGRWIWTWK